MNKSLVIVKPHAMGICSTVVADLESRISGKAIKTEAKTVKSAPKEFWQEFYNSNRERYYFWDNLMQKGFDGKGIFVAVYQGDKVQPMIKDVVGPTQVLKNPHDTIRGLYGRRLIESGEGIITLDDGVVIHGNVMHATDGTQGEFEREYAIFEKYLKYNN